MKTEPTCLIRSPHKEELHAVCRLIERVFNGCVAPRLSLRGQREFLSYASVAEMEERFQQRNFAVFVALFEGALAGVIEVRNFCHISLLFVDERFQRRGIGLQLFSHVGEFCRKNAPLISHITVNASLNAVAAYQKYGFRNTSAPQSTNEVHYQPMAYAVATDFRASRVTTLVQLDD